MPLLLIQTYPFFFAVAQNSSTNRPKACLSPGVQDEWPGQPGCPIFCKQRVVAERNTRMPRPGAAPCTACQQINRSTIPGWDCWGFTVTPQLQAQVLASQGSSLFWSCKKPGVCGTASKHRKTRCQQALGTGNDRPDGVASASTLAERYRAPSLTPPRLSCFPR